MRVQMLLAPLLALSSAGAAGVAQPRGATTAAPLRIIIPIVVPKCDPRPQSDGVIVVCGRKDDRFRIDPTVLAAMRSLDSRGGPRPDGRTTLFVERCSPVGLSTCGGPTGGPSGGMIGVIVTAAGKIARGDDLRPMLYTAPDDYQLYQQVKGEAETSAGGRE